MAPRGEPGRRLGSLPLPEASQLTCTERKAHPRPRRLSGLHLHGLVPSITAPGSDVLISAQDVSLSPELGPSPAPGSPPPVSGCPPYLHFLSSAPWHQALCLTGFPQFDCPTRDECFVGRSLAVQLGNPQGLLQGVRQDRLLKQDGVRGAWSIHQSNALGSVTGNARWLSREVCLKEMLCFSKIFTDRRKVQVSRPELQTAWGSSDHFATLPSFLPSGRTAVFSGVPHLVQICCGRPRRCLWGPRHPAAATCSPAAWRLPRPLGVDAGGADPRPPPVCRSEGREGHAAMCSQRRHSDVGFCVGEKKMHTLPESRICGLCYLTTSHLEEVF